MFGRSPCDCQLVNVALRLAEVLRMPDTDCVTFVDAVEDTPGPLTAQYNVQEPGGSIGTVSVAERDQYVNHTPKPVEAPCDTIPNRYWLPEHPVTPNVMLPSMLDTTDIPQTGAAAYWMLTLEDTTSTGPAATNTSVITSPGDATPLDRRNDAGPTNDNDNAEHSDTFSLAVNQDARPVCTRTSQLGQLQLTFQ